VPDAEDGREFGPQALGEPSGSLPAVDGLEPPPEDGRPLKWLDELELPSFLVDRIDEELHAFGVVDGALLPQVWVPFGTSSRLGSRPLFSNLWLGKLIGFGTFPRTVIPDFLAGVAPHLLSVVSRLEAMAPLPREETPPENASLIPR